jgi:[CysO sulfur-carrier protein]-S-L-cysteine hydrolase
VSDAPREMAPGPEAEAWRGAADRGATDRTRPAPPAWSPASTTVPRELLDQILEWCRAGVPNEACGLLAAPQTAEDGGTPTRFLPMKNAAASPYRYLMDPDEQLAVMLDIDDRDEIIWGIVHSHVASKPEPSNTDVGLAAYPDALYLICSLATDPPDLRAWTIVDGRVGEVVLQPG